MSLIEQLFGPKVGAKRNGPLNLYIQRNELQRDVEEKKRSQGSDPSFDPRTDIEDRTDPNEGIEGDFQSDRIEPGSKKFWDAEYKHYRSSPFTRTKLKQKQETKTVEQKPLKTKNTVEFSEQIEKLAPPQVKAYYREIGKLAKRILGLKRPIMLFTKQLVFQYLK